jgi:8-oxo-dGTP pyrophosphatase MutT (NUDIX family)
VTVKHLTSSVFVFRRHPDGWRIGLIRHPRFHRMMIPGGHVEPEESAAEAALREVAEETGLAVTLVGPPAAPVPPGYRGRRVAPPWWIAEYQVAGDNHLGEAHVHIDHLYVALADGTATGNGAAGDGRAEHPFGWYAAADLAGLDMFDDARLLARSLLDGLSGEADRAGAAETLVAGLSGAPADSGRGPRRRGGSAPCPDEPAAGHGAES